MADFSNQTLTIAGRRMLADAIADKRTIRFHTVAIGDGTAPQDPENLTSIVHPVFELGVGQVYKVPDEPGTWCVSCSFVATSDKGNFYCREAGIYASYDDEEDMAAHRVLFAYLNAGDTADYIQSVSAKSKTQIDLNFCLVVGAADVLWVYDPEQPLTLKSLDDLKASVNASMQDLTRNTNERVTNLETDVNKKVKDLTDTTNNRVTALENDVNKKVQDLTNNTNERVTALENDVDQKVKDLQKDVDESIKNFTTESLESLKNKQQELKEGVDEAIKKLDAATQGYVIKGGDTMTGRLNISAGGLGVTGGLTVITGNAAVSAGNLTVANGITVNAGGLAIKGGNASISAGNLTVANGITVATGGVTITAGGLTVTAGNASIAGGSLTVANGLTVTTGGLTLGGGNLAVNNGNITAPKGTITATSFVGPLTGSATQWAGWTRYDDLNALSLPATTATILQIAQKMALRSTLTVVVTQKNPNLPETTGMLEIRKGSSATLINCLFTAFTGNSYVGAIYNNTWTGWRSTTPVPAGMGGEYYGSGAAPLGWLFCEGQLLARSAYPALYAAIGTTWGSTTSDNFKLPDTRGQFLRGWDNSRGLDKSRKFATDQKSAIPNIKGDIFAGTSLSHIFCPTAPFYTSQHDTGTNTGGGGWQGTTKVSMDLSRSSSVYTNGITEARPTNIAVRYMIKY